MDIKKRFTLIKDLLYDSFALLFTFLLGVITQNLNCKNLLTAHQQTYLNSITIDEKSVLKSYQMYHTYLISLLISIILFALFITFSFYVISLAFLGFFLILSIIIPSFLIFKQSLLTTSKVNVIIMSYVFTIFSFALVYYVLQVNSIDIVKRISDINQTSVMNSLAFHIINIDSFNEVKDFEDFSSFLYYSIVTMTTLGFGDISPLSLYARIATSIQVLFSLIHIVFGLTIVFSNKDKDKKISQVITKILKS